jgi:tetratricopeptide (TPR) repeat protein
MAETNVNPTGAESYHERGSEYLGKEEWDKAIADFDEEIRLDPETHSGYFSRALCYDAKGDYDKAIADFTRSIRVSPDNPSHYDSRGETYLHKGDYDKAIADFNESIRICVEGDVFKPTDSALAYEKRGITYAAKGDFDAAYADWETILKMNLEDSTPKDWAKEMIAITQKQRAHWSGQLNLAANLIPLVMLQLVKKQLTKDSIFMAVGAVIGAILGILAGNGVLAFFLAGFFGTFKSTIGLFRSTFKSTSDGEESKTGWFIFSLVLSVLISPVWFIIKLVKRIKAFLRMRSVEKTLAKEIAPSAFTELGHIGEYIFRI